jgi:hypothetical protein
MTQADWREFGLHVGMPHLVPGRLSEEAIVKQLGAFQWQAVAALAGQPETRCSAKPASACTSP